MQVAMLSGLLDDLSAAALVLPDVLSMHLEGPMLAALAGASVEELCGRLESYMTRVRFKRGVVLFEHGDPSDTMFIVLAGTVASVFDLLQFCECGPSPSPARPCLAVPTLAPMRA